MANICVPIVANIQQPVPSEVRAKYVDIIDDILAKANLTEITEKRIRNGIQERVEYDITPQKVEKYKRANLNGMLTQIGGDQNTDNGTF